MNTLNGYSKSTLTDNYVLSAAGGHLPLVAGRLWKSLTSVTIEEANVVWYIKVEIPGWSRPSSMLIEGSYNNIVDLGLVEFSGFSHGYIYRNIQQNDGNVTAICMYASYVSATKKWTFWIKMRPIVSSAALFPASYAAYKIYFSESYDITATATTTDPGVEWQSTTTNLVIKNADLIGKATQDGNGNVIANTYLPLTGGTITGLITLGASNYANTIKWANSDFNWATAQAFMGALGDWIVRVTYVKDLDGNAITDTYSDLRYNRNTLKIGSHWALTSGNWSSHIDLSTYATQAYVDSQIAKAQLAGSNVVIPVTDVLVKTSGNFTTVVSENVAKIDLSSYAIAADCVKKSGDIMTGDLTIKRDSSDSPSIILQRAETNDSFEDWRMVNYAGYFKIQNRNSGNTWVDVLSLAASATKTLTSSYSVLPSADNALTLGNSTYKWKDVYATNFKGNADTATTSDTIKYHQNYLYNDNDDVNKCYEIGKLKLFRLNRSDEVDGKYYAGSRKINDSPVSYGFPAIDHANSLLWVGTHDNNYGHQLGFSSDGNIYHRRIINGVYSIEIKGGSWKKIAFTSDIPTQATDSVLGCIKIGYAQSDKNYPVQLDNDNKAFVNVPWTTPLASQNTVGGIKLKTGATAVVSSNIQQTNNYPPPRLYAVETTQDGTAFVCVPWTDTNTKVTSVNNHYKGSLGAKSSGLYKIEFDAAGHITDATAVVKSDITALGIPGSDTNTDTKVTSVDNHYEPVANTNSELSANATGATAAWGIDVVKGVQLQRDAKGHVTGVTVTSGKLPANPNTDTKNTAGSTNSTSKIYLIGATSQAANPQTYSNIAIYATDGTLTTSGVGKDGYIAYPKDGYHNSIDSSKTGYLCITLPLSWISTMIKFDVNIFNYFSNTSVTYTISGYMYESDSRWFNVAAYAVGHHLGDLSNLPVTFSHNGKDNGLGRCVVYIGTADTIWRYPQISISNITLGWSNTTTESWSTGWEFSFTSSSPDPTGNTNVIVQNTNVGYNARLLQGKRALDFTEKRSWTGTIEKNKWSRLCHVNSINGGSSYILNIENSAYYDITYIINSYSNNLGNVNTLNSSALNDSTINNLIEVRIVVDKYGNNYFEIKHSFEQQEVELNVKLIPISTGAIEVYTFVELGESDENEPNYKPAATQLHVGSGIPDLTNYYTSAKHSKIEDVYVTANPQLLYGSDKELGSKVFDILPTLYYEIKIKNTTRELFIVGLRGNCIEKLNHIDNEDDLVLVNAIISLDVNGKSYELVAVNSSEESIQSLFKNFDGVKGKNNTTNKESVEIKFVLKYIQFPPINIPFSFAGLLYRLTSAAGAVEILFSYCPRSELIDGYPITGSHICYSITTYIDEGGGVVRGNECARYNDGFVFSNKGDNSLTYCNELQFFIKRKSQCLKFDDSGLWISTDNDLSWRSI